jgi:hypothetical protein
MTKRKTTARKKKTAGGGGGKSRSAQAAGSQATGASQGEGDAKLLGDFYENVLEPGQQDASDMEFRSPLARKYIRDMALTEGAFPPSMERMLQEAVGDDVDQWQYTRWGAPINDISDMLRQQYLMDVDVYSRGNPLAFHALALTTAFGIGEGVKAKAMDQDNVQPVIDEHWEDPVNDWDVKIEDRFMGVTSYGELCMPAFVKGKNPRKGRVRYSNIHPARIVKVGTDPENVEDFRTVVVSPLKSTADKETFQIIRLDESTGLLDYDVRKAAAGQTPCHYFSINRIPSVPRGISDMFPALDWLAMYDDFLWTTSERARIALSVVWHVSMTNAKPDQVRAYAKKRKKVPRPNSIWVTNDRFDIKALVPELAGQDVRQTADILKHMILMGFGFPDFWFADSGSANRATSDQMGIPTSFRLLRRQRTFRSIVKKSIQFQIDQKVKLGVLPKNVNRKFKVQMPRIWLRDVTVIAKALNDIAASLLVAEDKEWVTHEQSAAIFQHEAMKLGIEIDEIAAEVADRESGAKITEVQNDVMTRHKSLCDRIAAGDMSPEEMVASGKAS